MNQMNCSHIQGCEIQYQVRAFIVPHCFSRWGEVRVLVLKHHEDMQYVEQ
jgi:hypothetical protein